MVYIYEKKPFDLTWDHVIVRYVRENRALAGYSDHFSHTYATIARFLIEQLNCFFAADMAH
jgi:hypothetical protein